MRFETFYSEFTQGRVFLLVVRLEKPATLPAFSNTMLDRVRSSADDIKIIVDIHTPGINATMVARKIVRVTVQDLSFELDCTQGIKLVEDPAMRFQLKVGISEENKQEFVVKAIVGKDEVCDMWLGFC
jgi:hypothetical protein